MARRRKRGDGSISLRKDGRWEGRFVIGYDENGLPKTKNVLAKTKSACAAKLKALKESIAVPKPSHLKPDMSFGQWLEYWYLNICKPNVRPKTQECHEQRIYKHILPELGALPLNGITPEVLQRFYTRLKQSGRLIRTERYGEGLSDRTVHGCHTTCRLALQRAVKDGLIRVNPAAACKVPSGSAQERQILTPDELYRLLIQAKEENVYELLLLEMSTGLRRGELLALQWDDMDCKKRTLHIQRQVQRIRNQLTVSPLKTKAADRIVMLPKSVMTVLREYRLRTPSRWMFPSPKKDDVPLDPTAVRKKIVRLLEHADCRRVRFHDLRHTFATMSIESGMDVKTLSTIIGHVSAFTTLNIYTHVTEDMRRTAASKIDVGIAKAEIQTPRPTPEPHKMRRAPFQPYKGQRRKAGTGCVSQLNDHLWEGRYSPRGPDGKKHSRNVYAHTREECEEKLAELIVQMKAEMTAQRVQGKACRQVV